MLVRAAVGIASGEPIKVVPEVNFVDLRELMTDVGAAGLH
jgi:hypothetical protein